MKQTITYGILSAVFCVFATAQYSVAQSLYKIEDTKSIEMKLLGTSTLHKWEMDARTVEGQARFGFKAGNEMELVSLSDLSFELEVGDLKSDNKTLDKNAYKALKADEFKVIRYKQNTAGVSAEKDGSFLIRTQGKLTIAGITREITMNVSCVINKDGTIICKGSDKLNMTDYQVKPPTFMLGAMKTGDQITLDFTLTYKKQKGA